MDEIILSIIVKFRESYCTLNEAIQKCQPGESIEGLNVDYFDELLHIFKEKRGKDYTYSTDRRYGNWRFILFGERDE